jgi:hypothetical protein
LGSGRGSCFESTNNYFVFAVRGFWANIGIGRSLSLKLFFVVYGVAVLVRV